jgi:DeoR/GlpR family transcriptional regulator of sugar metabolism
MAHSSPPVVLVTDAAQGIGRAIALEMGACGYTVALSDLAPATETLRRLGVAGATGFGPVNPFHTEHPALPLLAHLAEPSASSACLQFRANSCNNTSISAVKRTFMKGAGTMLTAERRRYIVDRLQRDGKIVAGDLSLELGVSDDTIRRDLRELAQAGMLLRVHGGALPRSPSTSNYSAREQEQPAAKAAIARRAAELMKPGQVVILDAGTTMLQVAQHIPADLSATIVTNSPAIAVALAEHPNLEIVVAGGRFNTTSRAAIGAATVRAYEGIHADLCFLGLAGLHPEAGLSILSYEEVFVKQAMIAGAERVAAVMTGDKLGTVAPYIVAPAAALTDLVTDRAAQPSALVELRATGMKVIVI